MSYVTEVKKKIKNNNKNETEFLQAVDEVLDSLHPLIEKNENYYKREAILERLTAPDRQIKFRVQWLDDDGQVHVNTGYRVQFNNVLGPYKGGLRLRDNVNIGIIKFLGFEQIFKNALTGLPIGGAKGGSDFDPKGKSDREILSFCKAFMSELYKYIGPDIDVPAGDIGVGAREIGYLFGQYKRLTSSHQSILTGKGLTFGGSLARTEATGYGLLYLTNAMLKTHGLSLENQRIVISGSGNVAIYAAEKAQQLGAKVIAMSDSTGYIRDDNGLDLQTVKNIKEIERGRIAEYVITHPEALYKEGKDIWSIPCEVALPCATQNELTLVDAKQLVSNGVKAVAEGANMPTTLEATHYLQKNEVLFAPGKAANAGGVAVSALEMSQNAERMSWSFEKVDKALQEIMEDIFSKISESAARFKQYDNYVFGANVAAFEKVIEAMIAQGI